MNKKFKVISFDLDNTLWEFAPVGKKAAHAEKLHIETNYPAVHNYLNQKVRTLHDIFEEVSKIFHHMIHDHNFLRRKSLETLASLAQLNDDESGKFVDSTFRVFDDTRQRVQGHFYPGVLEVLGQLHEQGYILVANTNGTAETQRIPELSKLFKFHINGKSAGGLKPTSAPFQQILAHTNVSKNEVLHVGDNLFDDVKGAVDFGMAVVWVDERIDKVDLNPSPPGLLSESLDAKNYLVARIPSVKDLIPVLEHLNLNQKL